MSSVTAVPLRPIAKGSVIRLWIGVALVLAAAGGLAWAGTRGFDRIATSESGLRFEVIEEGAGPSPTTEDVVLVSYVGTLPSGKTFDESQQAPMAVSDVVPGFSEALQKMRKGGHYQFWIPPHLGYGDKANGPIPANSTLKFDVHLLDFKSKAEIMQMQQQQMMMRGGGAPGR